MWYHTLFPYAGSSMGPGAFNEHLQLLKCLCLRQPGSLWELNGHGEGRSITTSGHCKVPPLSYLPCRMWRWLKPGKGIRELLKPHKLHKTFCELMPMSLMQTHNCGEGSGSACSIWTRNLARCQQVSPMCSAQLLEVLLLSGNPATFSCK